MTMTDHHSGDDANDGTPPGRSRRRPMHPRASTSSTSVGVAVGTVVSYPLDRLTGRRLRLALAANDVVDGPPATTTTTVKISRKLGEGGSAFVYLAKLKEKPSPHRPPDGGGGSLVGGSLMSPSSEKRPGGLFTPRRRKRGGHPTSATRESSTPPSPPSLVRSSSPFSPLAAATPSRGRRRKRLVVLKVSSVDTREGVVGALAEAHMLRRLSMNHPNVVRYYGNGFLSSSSSSGGMADRDNDGNNLGVVAGMSSTTDDSASAPAAVVADPSSSNTAGGDGGSLSAFDAVDAPPPSTLTSNDVGSGVGMAIGNNGGNPNVHWLMMEYCSGGSLLDLVMACRRQHLHDAELRERGGGITRMEGGSGSGSQRSVATSSHSSSKDGGPNSLRRVASTLLSPTRGGAGGSSSRWGGHTHTVEDRQKRHRYHRRLDVQEILTIFLHVCSAVSYMHSGGDVGGPAEGDDGDGDIVRGDAASSDNDDNDHGEEDKEKDGERKNENEKEEDSSQTRDAAKTNVVGPPSKEEGGSPSPSPSPPAQPSPRPSARPRRRKRGRRPILHLDIKLENILLVHPPSLTSSPTSMPPVAAPSAAAASETGGQHTAVVGNLQEKWRCKLCDLGSARVGRIPLRTSEERRCAEDVVRTTTTQMYRSPEMVDLYNTAGEITEKADVWALGCCLYNVVFLRNCFEANNSNLAILAGRYDVPSRSSYKSKSSSSSSPTNTNANNAEIDSHPYPDGLIELITDRMLVVDPERRATVDHVVECLHALQLGRNLPPRPGGGGPPPSEAEFVVDDGENDDPKRVVPSSPCSSPPRSRSIGDASQQDKENSPPRARKGKLLAPNSVAKRRMLLAKKRSSAASADPFGTLAASSGRSQSLWDDADEHDDTTDCDDSSSVASSLIQEGDGDGGGCVLFPAEPNDNNPHGGGGGGWVNFFSTATSCGGSDEVFGKKAGLPPLMRTDSDDEDRRMLMTKEPFAKQERGGPLSFRLGGPPATMVVEEAGVTGSFPRLSETPIKVPPSTGGNDGVKNDDGVLVTKDGGSNGSSSEQGSVEELTNLFARGDHWVEVVEVESSDNENENRKCVVSPTHECVEVSAFLLPGSSSGGDLNEARQRLLFSGSGE